MLIPTIEPTFVDRRIQLRFFDDVLSSLEQGERRHVALLGLRRIGKTMLLDEVRARHPDYCIPKLPVDTIVSTPEDFALEVLAGVLQAAANARGLKRLVTTQPTAIATTAALLGDSVVPFVEEILDLVAQGDSYGRLLSKVFAFPGAVSNALDLPMLVMLDEFQDIRRLQNFKNTENLWGALREALDRRGRVAFAIAGSIVTTLRKILHQGNDPLFTRFHELELPPFASEDTQDLAANLWERAGLAWDHNAVQRLQTLSQGFPFYVHTLSLGAGDLARDESMRVRGEHVDAVFQTQLLHRDSTISIYCQYLFQQALGEVRGENIPDAVLRQVARREGCTRAGLARAIRRAEGAAQVHRVVAELVDIDILTYRDNGLWFVDPILPVWIALERERREPTTAFTNPQARAAVTRFYEERISALQNSMGEMFEKRVHNLLRQFQGQTASGRLLGVPGQVALLRVDDVRRVVVPDPRGTFSGRPGSVEIDGITVGSETWAVEVKHQSGGVTAARVDRFLRACRFYEEETGNRIDRLWYISQTGFRSDARERCQAEGIYFSTTRDVAQLERVVAR